MPKRSYQIDANFRSIRERKDDETISISYIPTDKMAADIFTRVKGGNSQVRFDGRALYRISSRPSGVVRVSNQIAVLNLDGNI